MSLGMWKTPWHLYGGDESILGWICRRNAYRFEIWRYGSISPFILLKQWTVCSFGSGLERVSIIWGCGGPCPSGCGKPHGTCIEVANRSSDGFASKIHPDLEYHDMHMFQFVCWGNGEFFLSRGSSILFWDTGVVECIPDDTPCYLSLWT